MNDIIILVALIAAALAAVEVSTAIGRTRLARYRYRATVRQRLEQIRTGRI